MSSSSVWETFGWGLEVNIKNIKIYNSSVQMYNIFVVENFTDVSGYFEWSFDIAGTALKPCIQDTHRIASNAWSTFEIFKSFPFLYKLSLKCFTFKYWSEIIAWIKFL